MPKKTDRPKFDTNLLITACLVIVALGLVALTIAGRTARDQQQAQPSPSPGRQQALSHPFTIQGMKDHNYVPSVLENDSEMTRRNGYRAYKSHYVSDGLKISATLAIPDTPKPGKGYPVVILAHGFVPGSEYSLDSPPMQNVSEAYLSRGYATLTPAYRGHADSWGVQESAYYAPGYVHDLLYAAASLRTDPRFNRNKIGIIGHSLGGVVALKAAEVNPHWFKAVAVAAASTGSPEDTYRFQPSSELSGAVDPFDRNSLIRLFGAPSNSSSFWQSASLTEHVNLLPSYLYITHCEDDTNSPFRYSQMLAKEAKEAGKEVEFRPCETGDHSFLGESQLLLTNGSADFFDKQMKNTP